jgi:3-hydroxyacyl-[acyl-carrier-protein] dehydratase
MTMRDSILSARTAGPILQPDGAHAFEFNFKPEDPVFAGHFPGRPLLPGVFQLEIVRLAAEWILNTPLSVQEIAKAKFQRPVLPGEILKLNLKLSETDKVISARGSFVCGGQPAGEAFLKLAVGVQALACASAKAKA